MRTWKVLKEKEVVTEFCLMYKMNDLNQKVQGSRVRERWEAPIFAQSDDESKH